MRRFGNDLVLAVSTAVGAVATLVLPYALIYLVASLLVGH